MSKKAYGMACRNALQVYADRDHFAYLYGANGERPQNYAEAKALVDRLWSAYPSHFQSAVIGAGHTKDELIGHIIGRQCFDCSSFICAITQSQYPNLRVTSDYNSTGLINSCKVITTPAAGTAGSVLWRSGHVAYDVQFGMCVDFGNEFLDCRLYRIPDGRFVKSGQLPWVDYTGANAI